MPTVALYCLKAFIIRFRLIVFNIRVYRICCGTEHVSSALLSNTRTVRHNENDNIGGEQDVSKNIVIKQQKKGQ